MFFYISFLTNTCIAPGKIYWEPIDPQFSHKNCFDIDSAQYIAKIKLSIKYLVPEQQISNKITEKINHKDYNQSEK